MIFRQVDKSEIPQHIFDSMSQYISWYTVGLRCIDEKINKNTHIGTGTLIDVEGRKGILTAKHVTKELRGANKVGLMIMQNTHGYEIEKDHIEIINIDDNLGAAKNIDLSVIIIPESLLGSIKANMSFYILSNKKDEILKNSILTNEGVWVLCGFPGEFEEAEIPQKGFDEVYGYVGSCIYVNKIESEYICDDYDLGHWFSVMGTVLPLKSPLMPFESETFPAPSAASRGCPRRPRELLGW